MCYHYRFHFFNDKIDFNINNNSESIAQRIIRLLNGNKNKFSCDSMVNAMNRSLICYAEHGLAASTFAARITSSTLSDSYSSICSGICTLKGNLHGGANEAAMDLIKSFDDIHSAEDGIENMLDKKELIMGFGHRIYKKGDPRSVIMKDTAIMLAEQSEFGAKDLMNIAQVIEGVMFEKKGIYTNMDFYAAMVYYQCGIPKNLYTPIFVCSRTTGWFAHIMEQRKNNKLIRPSSNYVGPQIKKFVPIDD